eukprot:11157162-Lingulodinium_polyedra.AAC.1
MPLLEANDAGLSIQGARWFQASAIVNLFFIPRSDDAQQKGVPFNIACGRRPIVHAENEGVRPGKL